MTLIDSEPAYGPRPRDYVQAADLALNLILKLRDEGTLTVSGAAADYGLAPSTVHRSMAMLVYRGFATKNESRSYLPGPALRASSLPPGVGAELVGVAEPYMSALSAETGETCHLVVLVGDKCHFLHSVEGSHPVRVGNRRGQTIPATESSGGLGMLAQMSAGELRGLYPTMSDGEFDDLRRTLHRTRSRGFSVNNGLHEHDVSAVGACLLNELGDIVGALTVAVPTTRFKSVSHDCATAMLRHVRDLNRRLAGYRVG